MKGLYSETTFRCSKLITQHYSTSFTLGINALQKRFHFPVYAIYGFVRYADEIVDTLHSFDQEALLRKFRSDTYEAIENRISLNPVLHSFQIVVNEYQIEKDLIESFFRSMEMDLYKKSYSRVEYETYIYGSAEAVGLICLRVFCEGDRNQYSVLKPSAMRLGAAFQKVNFLRDMRSDFKERGRVYFPGVTFSSFDHAKKTNIEKDIQQDFQAALTGIRKLPTGAKLGVYLAYLYYMQLFKKIQKLSSSKILQERVRIPDFQKALVLSKTLLLNRLNYLR